MKRTVDISLQDEIDYWYDKTGSLTSEVIIKRAHSLGIASGLKQREVYSEEDLRKAFVKGALTDLFNTWSISDEDMANEKFQEWFEQFKKTITWD